MKRSLERAVKQLRRPLPVELRILLGQIVQRIEHDADTRGMVRALLDDAAANWRPAP